MFLILITCHMLDIYNSYEKTSFIVFIHNSTVLTTFAMSVSISYEISKLGRVKPRKGRFPFVLKP
jgi:hypothetical protein